MQKTIKVSINGMIFTITTDEHQDDIECAARLVDTLIKEKVEKHAGLSSDRAILVVAMSLATDAIQAQRRVQHYEEKVAQLTSVVAEQVRIS